jgi:hypothetical protein
LARHDFSTVDADEAGGRGDGGTPRIAKGVAWEGAR